MRRKIRTRRDIAIQTALVTGLSVLASVVVTVIVTTMLGTVSIAIALIPAILVPLMVAPPITYRMSVLHHRLYLQKKLVERMAAEDSLTGLANRRAFFTQARYEFLLARRHRQRTSIIMCDIDHFKRINDKYGHTAGDRVIVEVAKAIREEIRESDIAARIGGEEYVIFLYDAGAADATRIAERIRARIAGEDFGRIGVPDQVTVSFGVAESPFAASVKALMDLADAKLFEAKDNGRNRVETSAATVSGEPSAQIA